MRQRQIFLPVLVMAAQLAVVGQVPEQKKFEVSESAAESAAKHSLTTAPDSARCTNLDGDPEACPQITRVEPDRETAPSGALTTVPKDLFRIQLSFWTSPARLRQNDFGWLFPIAAFSAGMIASDTEVQKHLPSSASFIQRSQTFSDFGAVAFAGLSGGAFLWGRYTNNDHLRNTGLWAGEAMTSSLLATEMLKPSFQRQRPGIGDGNGRFWNGGDSFPSTHSAVAWSAASVIAAEYPGLLTKVLAYGGAAAVSATRVSGRKHFSSDVLIGSALGWYMGRQVLRLHERQDAGDARFGSFPKTSSEDHTSRSETRATTYVPLDSWTYPALERLAALGILKTDYLGLRPWTRRSVYEMLRDVDERELKPEHARMVSALKAEFRHEDELGSDSSSAGIRIERLYSRSQSISGTPLNDSFHFGQTIANDFGRPFGRGWQQLEGVEASAESSRLSFHFRGEYQHLPGIVGYGTDVAEIIAKQDSTPLMVHGGMPSRNVFRLLDTYVSMSLLGHEVSVGKQSYWWGPAMGSSMVLSNNTEPFYSLRINRTTPLYIPLLSRLVGPVRYDNFFGRLSGHQFPPDVYFYGQKVALRPTDNLELGFSRNAVIGGRGVAPLTLDTFWRSFSSTASGWGELRRSPGARHAGFDFRYRLPGLRNRVTLYTDSVVHDDVSPVSAPRRAAVTSGIYLTRIPLLPRFDLHVEGGTTDTVTSRAKGGNFYYYQQVYRDGYTNKGYLLGSSLGREGTGGQAWATYWLGPQSSIRFGYRTLKVSQYFVPQGETQQDAYVQLQRTWQNGFSLGTMVQVERWVAPVLAPGPQTNVTTVLQISFNPKGWGISKE